MRDGGQPATTPPDAGVAGHLTPKGHGVSRSGQESMARETHQDAHLCDPVGRFMPAPDKPAHLFLSYARDDAEFVKVLRTAIEARGWTTWMDQVSIPSAAEWMAEIRRGIESADGFVMVLTPSAVASRMCRVELSIAVDLSKRLLPVRALTNAAWATAVAQLRERLGPELITAIPPEIEKLDYVDINDFQSADNPIDALVDELLAAAARDLEWLHQHTRLQQDVKRWVEERYAREALLRGAVLQEAEAMLAAVEKEPPLTALQREFVERSRAERLAVLTREAAQLARRVLDLPEDRIAIGVMAVLEGLSAYVRTAALEGALRTLLARWPQRLLIRHEHYARSAEFSADESKVMTAATDGWLRWIDASTGEIIRTMGHTDVPIMKAVLRSDGRTAAAACADGYIRIFDLEAGTAVEKQVSADVVEDLAVSGDGSTIVGTSGRALAVIDTARDIVYQLPRHPESVKSLKFFAPLTLVTTCGDGKVRFIHLDEQRCEEFALPDQTISDVCVSPDGTWIGVCGSFSGVGILDVATRSITRQLDTGGESGLMLALSANAERLAVTTIWGGVLVFNPLTAELLMKRRVFPRYAWHVGLNHDGSLFSAASDSGIARVGDVGVEGWWTCAGHDGPVRAATFDSSASRLLTTGADCTVRIFEVGRIPGRLTIPHASTVISAEVSPDGATIATTAQDGVARVFDVDTGAVLATFAPQGLTPLNAAFVSSDELLVACREGTIAFVDVRSGTERRSVSTSPIETNSEVRVTGDSRWLVVSLFDEIVRVLNASDGSEAAIDGQERARISADLQDQTGLLNPRGRLRNRNGQSPFIERDGTSIDLKTREHQVVVAAFAPDGSVVAGAALNRAEIPIFDATNGELVATLRLSHPSNDIRFSRNGRTLVARWLNAVSAVRYATAEELVERARRQVYRELTPSERTEFGLPVAPA